jgi:DNA-binding CsgD family transcriptional regulator
MVGVDLRRGCLTFSFEGGFGPAEGVIDYARKYHRLDPHAQHLAPKPVGSMVAYSREFSPAFIDRHPFYQDFLIPYGVRHSHGAKLYQDESTVVLLGFHRAVGKEPIDDDDWQLAAKLCLHLQRAIDIYLGMQLTLAHAAVGRDTLDRLASPVFLIDEQRRVVLQNSAAVRTCGGSFPLYVDPAGRLCCDNLDSDGELSLAVRALKLSGERGLQAEAAVDRAIVRMTRSGKPRPILACLLALRPEATMGAFGMQAQAMVVVHDANVTADIDAFGLSAAFELSPAEGRVAVALAKGDSPKDIARRHGVSYNTVRSQVAAVQSKLGVSRTADVVAVIHSLSFGAVR